MNSNRSDLAFFLPQARILKPTPTDLRLSRKW